MTEIREIVELVDKFTELTQNNKISWEKQEPGDLINRDNKIDFIFIAKYKEKIIRLYKEEYKYYFYDEDVEKCRRDSRIVLEFIDEYGSALWPFPQTANSWDLLNAVQYKDAKVGEFLQGIM